MWQANQKPVVAAPKYRMKEQSMIKSGDSKVFLCEGRRQ
jgi:hypothetical protein